MLLATHEYGHTLPAFLAFLALVGSLGLGLWLFATFSRRSPRTGAVLAALFLAGVSFTWLKAESDTWWNRRCDSGKPGCGDAPPIIPFTSGPRGD